MADTSHSSWCGIGLHQQTEHEVKLLWPTAIKKNVIRSDRSGFLPKKSRKTCCDAFGSGRIACAKQNNFASGGHVNVVERFTQTCIKQFIFVGLATMISSSARHHMVPKTYIGSMLLCDFLVWSTPSTGAGSLKSQGKSSTGHTKGPWQPWQHTDGVRKSCPLSTSILLLSWPHMPPLQNTHLI